LSDNNSFERFEQLGRERFHKVRTDEFQATMEKSQKECTDLIKMNEFVFAIGCILIAFRKVPTFFNKDRYIPERYSQSLVFTYLIESARNSACIVYLSGCGLYKNAYLNIRYALESIIQASYIDSSYPDFDFPTKVEVLEMKEDLRRYRATQLVKRLHIDYKEQTIEAVRNEYKKLSRKLHSSHYQFMATSKNFMYQRYKAVYMDCDEVTSIYNSMKVLHDVSFFLLIAHFPEIRKPLVENTKFVETVKSHNLILSSRILGI